MLMETKITLGQTPTHLSPTHSTPLGDREKDHISYQHLLPANGEEKVAQKPSQSSQRDMKALKGQLVQDCLSNCGSLSFIYLKLITEFKVFISRRPLL